MVRNSFMKTALCFISFLLLTAGCVPMMVAEVALLPVSSVFREIDASSNTQPIVVVDERGRPLASASDADVVHVARFTIQQTTIKCSADAAKPRGRAVRVPIRCDNGQNGYLQYTLGDAYNSPGFHLNIGLISHEELLASETNGLYTICSGGFAFNDTATDRYAAPDPFLVKCRLNSLEFGDQRTFSGRRYQNTRTLARHMLGAVDFVDISPDTFRINGWFQGQNLRSFDSPI